MRIRTCFFWLTALLVVAVSILLYQVFYAADLSTFYLLEGLVLLVVCLWFRFYRRVVKPLYLLGNGMDLLNEQDFASRLGRVGQLEADRVVEVFNKMMDQLKNERLQVREQNQFLDLLVQASPLGVLICDLDDRLLSLNPAACRLLAVTRRGEWIGKTLRELDNPLVEELREIPMDQSRTIRLGDASIYKCTHSSFIDQGYQHPFFLVESLTEELFKAERKAYEKVIRMISHEVNNTMAGITSTLDTLESTFHGDPDMADICEVLQVSIDRCYGLSRFITRFADVVRIPEPFCQSVELNSLVTNCSRFMEKLCQEKSIVLKWNLCPVSPVVFLDAALFEQVLLNILKNAAESIAEGGGIIELRTVAEPAGVEIIDNGRGIDKETESKLFTPFFSSKPNGQGLGLIFIREVLERHRCSFSLRTYADGWTRFKITFPLRKNRP